MCYGNNNKIFSQLPANNFYKVLLWTCCAQFDLSNVPNALHDHLLLSSLNERGIHSSIDNIYKIRVRNLLYFFASHWFLISRRVCYVPVVHIV
mgnify:CR=1 FL=1